MQQTTNINSWCQKYWMIQDFYKPGLFDLFHLDLKDLMFDELFKDFHNI